MNFLYILTTLIGLLTIVFAVLYVRRGAEIRALRAELIQSDLLRRYAVECRSRFTAELTRLGYRSIQIKTLMISPLQREVLASLKTKTAARDEKTE